jgi:hypothetical protein
MISTKIQTDASNHNGISAILYQHHEEGWKPVNCASHFLMQAEKNYHPIELEMQSVTWGCEKMTPYLQGLPYFLVQTDHEPLVPILNYKPLIEMSPRIQDTRTRLLHFKFTAGKELKDADCLSRSPEDTSPEDTPTKEDV